MNGDALPAAGTGDREAPVAVPPERIDWGRNWPFLALHLAVLAVPFAGISAFAVGTALFLYVVRMFFITGFYHRYFSHRTFRTSRAFQFLMGLAGTTAVQQGPIWWAAHHRHHHNHSDEPDDAHSPRRHGFWWAHMAWFLTRSGSRIRERFVRDWLQYPELRTLDRLHVIPPVLLAAGLFLLGMRLEEVAPGLGTNGPQLLAWGFVVSTVLLYHGTYTINSLSHKFGTRRYDTGDDSRNNFLLALVTLGEGWHNNHHHYPAAARQGFLWWEIDLTYYGLRLLAALGLVRRLNPVPARVLAEGRRG